jgi:signal transduction histidine kinase
VNLFETNQRSRILLLATMTVVYVFAYLVLRQYAESRAAFLITLPLVAASWLFGIRVGVAVWATAILFNTVMMMLTGDIHLSNPIDVAQLVLGYAVLFVIVLAIGSVNELSEKLRRELVMRQEAERIEHQRNAELEAVYLASLKLTSMLELQPILEMIMSQVTTLLHAQNVHVFLYDGDKLTLGAAIIDGVRSDKPFSEPRENGLTYSVARNNKRMIITNAGSSPTFSETSFKGAIAGFPLAVGERVLGVMNIAFATPHDYSENELRIIQLLADQAATALRNAQDYEKTRHYAEELEGHVAARTAELVRSKESAEALVVGLRKVLALTYDLISSPDIDSLWKRAVESSREVFGLDRCAIFVHNDGYMTGTYGTDSQGQTSDEHENRWLAGNYSWMGRSHLLSSDAPMWEVTDDDYYEWRPGGSVVVGHGWVVITPIHSAYRFIGILINDAMLTHAPIDPVKQEIVAMFCSFLGSLYEHKRVEDEIRRALEREKELGELKSRFTSMISHELRTPLASIQLASDLLKNYYSRMEESARLEHLNKIQGQVRHLTNLLEDVLTFTRAEQIGMELKQKLVDLNSFCADLSAEVRATNASHKIAYVDDTGNWSALVDPKLMRQALMNLMLNAVKYSPAGSTVTLSLDRDGKDAVIRVADQGIGIPEADLPHIFEVFYRARNVGAVSGTGLGLALVRQIAEAHHGFIFCESEVGAGTTFTLRIPAFSEISDEGYPAKTGIAH